MPNIDEVITYLDRDYIVRMISTSYEFFIRAFCDKVKLDFSKTRCTAVSDFDKVALTSEEKELLLKHIKYFAGMPLIQYNSQNGEVLSDHLICYDDITEFVWEIVYEMSVGGFLRHVHPVGQRQKKEAVEQICADFKAPGEKVLYVGDSQTDVQAVEYVRQNGGLTMMFNGKGKVCRLSDIMYIGEDAQAIKEVADVFAAAGRQGTIAYYEDGIMKWDGFLASVTPENIDQLEKLSVKKRKEFRGIHIGDLT